MEENMRIITLLTLMALFGWQVSCGREKPSYKYLTSGGALSADSSFRLFVESTERLQGEPDAALKFAQASLRFQVGLSADNVNDLQGRCVLFLSDSQGFRSEKVASHLQISEKRALLYTKQWSYLSSQCQDVFLDAMPDMSVEEFFASHVSFLGRP